MAIVLTGKYVRPAAGRTWALILTSFHRNPQAVTTCLPRGHESCILKYMGKNSWCPKCEVLFCTTAYGWCEGWDHTPLSFYFLLPLQRSCILWQNHLLNLLITCFDISTPSCCQAVELGNPIPPNPSPQPLLVPERAAKTFNLTLTAWSSTGGSKTSFRSFPRRAGRSRAGHDAQLLEEREGGVTRCQEQHSYWGFQHPSWHHKTFTEGDGNHPLYFGSHLGGIHCLPR